MLFLAPLRLGGSGPRLLRAISVTVPVCPPSTPEVRSAVLNFHRLRKRLERETGLAAPSAKPGVEFRYRLA